MAFEGDCSLEIVRQFILSNGAKVRNPDLVNRFKKFLNDPENKVENRSKFKDYVNTLATIKIDETGEKILRLKKKYLDSSTETTAAATPAAGDSSYASRETEVTPAKPDSIPPRSDVSATPQDVPKSQAEEPTAKVANDTPPEVPKKTHQLPPSPLTERNNKRNKTDTLKTPKQNGDASMNDDLANMTVMERAKHLNKIQLQTETDLRAAHKRRDNKAFKHRDGDDEETSSIGYVTLTEAERKWLCTCAQADYHPMSKMLTHNPGLAKVKDFTNGYTALHWAAKHGKQEVVKMIAGRPGINVNQKSHGGYTPLHLAAMHGHEDIIELLVHTYKADPNIRDNSGKRPKQYLKNSASSRINQAFASSMSLNPVPIRSFAEILLSKRSSSSQQDENLLRNSNVRQSSRARALTTLLQTSSSIMKQPFIQNQLDDEDKVVYRTRSGTSSPRSTPPSSPHVIRRGSQRMEKYFNLQRHSLNTDSLAMRPPSTIPNRLSHLKASSSDNIPNDVMMTRTTSDPNVTRISGSVFV